MTGADIIRDVSRDLNDQDPGYEYTLWPQTQLQSFLREALVEVGRSLRDLFTSEVIVKVQAGANWQKACDCDTIVRIVGESAADGTVLRYLSRSIDIEENTWAGPAQRCQVSPKDYVMTGYQTSLSDEAKFRVFPPVPPGVIKYVLLECYNPGDASLTGAVPGEVEAIVKQWMLYRAWMVDGENNPASLEVAQIHQKTYFTLLATAIADREREKEDGNIRTVQNSSSE